MSNEKEMTLRERFFVAPVIFAVTAGILNIEYDDLSDKSFTSWGQWMFLILAAISLLWATFYWFRTKGEK